MIKKTNFFGYRINFVLRHKYEKDSDFIDKMEWREYRLGIWFKKYMSVGKPKDGPAIIGKDGTFTNSYMFGINLLICKCWVDISYRPLIIEI